MASKLNALAENNHGAIFVLAYFCPGCRNSHAVSVNGHRNSSGATWKWNGSMERPTFTPSILCNKDVPEYRCHHFIRSGYIEFLNDCFHALKGQTVPLPEAEGLC